MIRYLRPFLPAALLIASTFAPAAAQPPPPYDPGYGDIVPGRMPFPFGSPEPFTIERVHTFLAGGISLLTSESLINAWLLAGWTLTGGVEVPVSSSWTLVPRLHLSGASGENSGAMHWVRLALDGRISSRGGSYEEAGFGLGLLDAPVSVTDATYMSHLESRWSGTPFFQIIAGLRGNPEDAPAFMTEVIGVFALGAERPSGLELLAGIEF